MVTLENWYILRLERNNFALSLIRLSLSSKNLILLPPVREHVTFLERRWCLLLTILTIFVLIHVSQYRWQAALTVGKMFSKIKNLQVFVPYCNITREPVSNFATIKFLLVLELVTGLHFDRKSTINNFQMRQKIVPLNKVTGSFILIKKLEA